MPVQSHPEPTSVSVSSTEAVIVKRNRDRTQLIMSNVGTEPIIIWLTKDVTTTFGILLSAGGGLMALDVTRDEALCTAEWHAISANPATLAVVEVTTPGYADAQDKKAL